MRSTLTVALFAFATAVTAQVHETVNVDITNVDVTVLDSKGNPVTGLTKNDFELFEGKQKRDITNFLEVSKRPAAATSQATQTSSAILIFFDNTSLTLGMRRQATDALKAWLPATLRPTDRVAVLAAIPGLQTKQAWTFDVRNALAALDVVGSEATSGAEQERHDARARVDDVVRRAATASQREQVSFDEAVQAVRTYASAAMWQTHEVIASMASAMSSFPLSAQKKVFIVVGEGLQTNPGADMFQYLNSVKMDIESGAGPAMLVGGARDASPMAESGQFDVEPALRALTRAATRAGVTIYAINPGQNESASAQVQESKPSDSRAAFATAAGSRAGYELLVRATGGEAFFGAPPAAALNRVATDLDRYYSIGFKSIDPQAPIVVKSKQGYEVRTSRGSAPQTADDVMRDAVLSHHVTAPVSNDLKIALAADPPVTDGTTRTVHLKVLIPIASLQFDRQGDNVAGAFVVYISSGDSHGTSTKVNRQEKQLLWPAAALEQLKAKMITFAVDVKVPPGLNQISVGVLDQKSQQTGFERTTIGS